MEGMIENMIIDEERKNVLTSYSKTKKGTKIQESDHHTIITNVNTGWNKNVKKVKQEMYNLKDEESLKKFKEMTQNNTFLSEVFEDEDKNIETKTKQFMKNLSKNSRK